MNFRFTPILLMLIALGGTTVHAGEQVANVPATLQQQDSIQNCW